MGRREKNSPQRNRKGIGGGTGGKTGVVGAKDRDTNQVAARVIGSVDGETLNTFVDQHTDSVAEVYTGASTVHKGRPNHEAIAHSAGEYVRYRRKDDPHELRGELLVDAQAGSQGDIHRLSPKHVHRYLAEFVACHYIRDLNTIRQLEHIVARMVGKRLVYRDLIAENGRSRVAGKGNATRGIQFLLLFIRLISLARRFQWLLVFRNQLPKPNDPLHP